MAEDFMYVDVDTGNPVNVPTNQGSGGGSYIPSSGGIRDSKADLLEKIRPDIIVEVIRNKLMGKEFNESTKRWETSAVQQKFSLTEEGATQIANLMLGVSSQNVSLSNLKDHEIKN